MPRHFFLGSLRIDYASAVRADSSRQNCGVCPRYWYVDTVFQCARCGSQFLFTAEEQRIWYEEYGFWVDAFPKRCVTCRRDLRRLKDLRREYDREVASALELRDLESKKRLADIIDHLYEIGGDLPPRINENRKRLARQIAALEKGAA
jgi:DNA-directed RNA polymerase subunit RPC12/RpoP